MPAIRRQILIATSPRALWGALTTPEQLSKWLADEVRLEPRAGGRIVLGWRPEEGQHIEARGLIHTWRPISHLEVAWERTGEYPARGSRVTFQVARDGEEARLTLLHQGGEGLEDEAIREIIDRNWKKSLDTLQTLLDAPAGTEKTR
jgi:uncharacterized protein YndB with AHSA1/START domain